MELAIIIIIVVSVLCIIVFLLNPFKKTENNDHITAANYLKNQTAVEGYQAGGKKRKHCLKKKKNNYNYNNNMKWFRGFLSRKV